jgi:outer membrane protein OmpA-like peptidoglycan-associated protein
MTLLLFACAQKPFFNASSGTELEPSARHYLTSLYFNSNQEQLTQESKKEVLNLVQQFANDDQNEKNILIEAYSDTLGSIEYNAALSWARGHYVQRFLQQHLPMKKFYYKIASYGRTKVIDSRNNTQAWQKNRRVDIYDYE